MLKNFRRLFTFGSAAVTTFPIWFPFVVVLAVLHLIGWAKLSPNVAGKAGEARQVGMMWTLELPTHWLPFVSSTFILALGLRWLPSSWRLQMIRRRMPSGTFVHFVVGFFDLTFTFSELYQLSADA